MKQTHEAAERELLRAREELLHASPAAVNAAAKHLENVAAWLGQLTTVNPAALRGIRRQVANLWPLLESARAFYSGLAHLRVPDDSGTANYTRAGQTCVSPAARPSLITHG